MNIWGKKLQVDDTSLIFKGARLFPAVPEVPGTVWYVNGSTGDNALDGKSWGTALLTMANAFTRIGSGDVIAFKGNIREQISTPAGVFDCTIIGAGNQPRHSDAHTGNNGYSGSTWKLPASPTATTPLLTIRQQGWRLMNILFDGPADAPAVRLFRDAGAGDLEDDASHAHIVGCKFVAAQNHIDFNGGLSQCVIEGNLFFGATADSILETVGAGVGTNNYHRILNNDFHDNESHIDVATNFATIKGNTFGKFTTDAVNLIGGTYNSIWGNQCSGTYSISGGYRTGTNDEWGGNYNSLSGGVTASDPA